jgi:hypothetical protein
MSSSVHFIKNGNTYSVAPKGSIKIETTLPAETFSLKFDPHRGFYLEEVESFTLPPKVYGDTLRLTDRILYTFNNRNNSTGVLLVGEKGSGKTLLARSLSINGAEQGIPTIVINSAFKGDEFNSLVQSIDQPCIILFDEFEKIYDKDSQEKILTLLDGVFQSKKLFVLTSNDKYKIDTNMRNRPGRIYYLLDFKGLDEGFIREYCKDNLKNMAHLEELIKISSLFDVFNFDLLVAFVEELNRYDESPIELLPLLNAKPEYCSGSAYEVKSLVFRGIPVPRSALNKHCLVHTNFNLASNDWSLDCTIVFDINDHELKEKFSNTSDTFDYDIDFIHDMMLQERIRFQSAEDSSVSSSSSINKLRSRISKISLGNIVTPVLTNDDDEPSTISHNICVVVDPSDIIQYTPNGANYKNPDGFVLEVKKSKTRRGSSSSYPDFNY